MLEESGCVVPWLVNRRWSEEGRPPICTTSEGANKTFWIHYNRSVQFDVISQKIAGNCVAQGDEPDGRLPDALRDALGQHRGEEQEGEGNRAGRSKQFLSFF